MALRPRLSPGVPLSSEGGCEPLPMWVPVRAPSRRVGRGRVDDGQLGSSCLASRVPEAGLKDGESGAQSSEIDGVVSAKLDAVQALRIVGDLTTSIGFAINASLIRSFLENQGLSPAVGASANRRSAVEIAARAKRITVPIECLR